MAKYDIPRAWEMREKGYSLSQISKKTGIPKPYLSFLFSYSSDPKKCEEKIKKLEREKEKNENIIHSLVKEATQIIFVLYIWLFTSLSFSLGVLSVPSQKNIDIYTYFAIISIIILLLFALYKWWTSR